VTWQDQNIDEFSSNEQEYIKKIPFPLEGTAGYIHSQLSELRSLPLIVFIFMFYQTKTQEKMKYLIETQSLIPTANLQVPL
jgi:hypothetical protein